jgi:hypothetical protein
MQNMSIPLPLAAGSIGERQIGMLGLQYLDDRIASVSAGVVDRHTSRLADCQ